jgi:hypothetical protein
MADEQKPKQVVEWSFSFEQVGESVNRMLGKISGDQEVKTERFSIPLEGTRAASVHLSLSIGTADVHALNAGDNLFQADVKYTGEMEFTVTGDAEKSVKLGQKRSSSVTEPIKNALGRIVNREDLHWDIGISPEVPVELHVDGGIGSNNIDLTNLRLANFQMVGGVGETRLTLPSGASNYVAEVNGGVGNTTIVVPDGAALRLRLQGGVGGVNLHLPENAAARVEVSGGLGGASLPARFTRTKGGDEFISQSGTWETPGYALAQQQIFVQFQGGVGGLKVT